MLSSEGKQIQAPSALDVGRPLLTKLVFLNWLLWMSLDVIGLHLFGGELQFTRAIPPLFAMAALGVQMFRGVWPRLPRRGGFWILLYFAWCGLSMGWTTMHDKKLEFLELVIFGTQLLFICLAMSHPRDREPVMRSVFSAIVTGGWVMTLHLLTVFRPGKDLRLEEGIHPNAMGHRIALAALCAIFLWSRDRKQRIWTASVAVLVMALLLTTSKGSLGAFVLCALAFLMSSQSGLSRKKRLRLIGGIVICAVLVLPLVMDYFVEYEESSQVDTLSGRAMLWAMVLPEDLRQPWLGHGFKSFTENWPEGKWFTGQAHNEFLQEWFNVGLVGVALIAMAYLGLFRWLWRSRSAYARFGVYFLGYYMIRDVLESDDAHLQFALLFAYTIAIAVRRPAAKLLRRRDDPPMHPLPCPAE